MKGRFLPYLRLQTRRVARLFPAVLAIGAVLLLAVAAMGLSSADTRDREESRMQVEIGVVGDLDSPYVQTLLYTLNHLDGARFSLRLVQMEEETARRRLVDGDLHSYLIIPEGFADAMENAAPFLITYVSSPTSTGLSNALMDEIVHSLSPLITEGDGALLALRRFARANGHAYLQTNEAMQSYTSLVFSRSRLFAVEETGVRMGQGFERYLLSSLSAFFLLIWGVAAAPLFAARRGEIGRQLAAAGLSAAGQIAAEYAAYLLLVFAGAALALGGFAAGASLLAPGVWRTLFPDGAALFGYFARASLVALCFSALHFLIYECTRGSVAGLLAQTFVSVAMGYVCGCFYAANFFSPLIERVGQVLPAGAAIRFLSGDSPEQALLLSGYFALFLLLIFARRRAEMAGDTL